MIDRTAQFVNGTAIAAGQTAASVVSAVPGRKIRVLWLRVFPTTTPPASITLNSASTAISPVLPLVASTPLQVGSEVGLCETARGDALTVTNPSGTTLAVFTISYVVI